MSNKRKLIPAQLSHAVEQLGVLRYFPSEPGARLALMALLERMVTTGAELDWLVRTMIDEVGEWQGSRELRGVFCTRYRPADGVEAECATGKFSPAAMECRMLDEHADVKQLGAGESGAMLPAVRRLQ